MNILTQSMRYAASLFVMILLLVQSADAQPKRRVYIEEYTGAWCQYCPNGAVAFEELGKQYTEDEVIMAAVHQTDGMSMSNQNDFAPYINGVPSGSILRIYNGVSPGSWAGYIPGIISQDASAEVTLKNVSFNSGTRRVTCQLEARFYKDVAGPVRVNIVVVEDSVVGSGSQFDQVNAFNTTQGHPFYQRGNPVKNYAHRHVARLMVDGTWGATGVITDNPKAGSVFTKNYSFTVNASWKPEKMSLVGLIQKYSDNVAAREILQAVQESLLIRSTRATLEHMSSNYLKIAAGKTITQTVKVTNDNNQQLTFDLAVNDSKSYLPADWTATVEPATLTLDKGASAEVVVTIESPKSIPDAELATVVVDATPQEAENTKPKTNSVSVYVLPETAKSALVYDLNIKQFVDYYRESIKANERFGPAFVSLPNNPTLLDAYKDQFQVYVYSVFGGSLLNGQIYTGLPIGTTTDGTTLAKSISDMLDQGKRVYLSAPQSMWWAFNTAAEAAAGKNPEVVNFFKNTLKLQYVKSEQRYVLSGNQLSLKQYGVKGFDGDSIGDQFNGTANLNFSYNNFNTDIFKLATGSTCVPVIYSDNSTANIVGVRYTSPQGGKLVFVTQPIESYDNMVPRETFLTKSLEWLAGDIFVAAKNPVLTLNTDVKFGSVELGQSKPVGTDISNTGEADLIITEMGVSGSMAPAFTIVDKPALPLTIKPGEKKTINVSFKPEIKKSYMASLDFTSNDGGGAGAVRGIDLIGEGIETVPDKPVFTGVADLNVGQTSTTANKALSLTNNTSSEVKVVSAVISGADASAFSVNAKDNTIVPIGQKFQTMVTFTPTHVGMHNAVLTLNTTVTSTGKTGTYTVNLVGEKVEASGVKEDLALTSSMQIVPNPTAQDARLSFEVAERSSLGFSIADLSGAILYSLNGQIFETGSHSIMLPVSTFAAGRYTVTIRSQSGATTTLPLNIVR